MCFNFNLVTVGFIWIIVAEVRAHGGRYLYLCWMWIWCLINKTSTRVYKQLSKFLIKYIYIVVHFSYNFITLLTFHVKLTLCFKHENKNILNLTSILHSSSWWQPCWWTSRDWRSSKWQQFKYSSLHHCIIHNFVIINVTGAHIPSFMNQPEYHLFSIFTILILKTGDLLPVAWIIY